MGYAMMEKKEGAQLVPLQALDLLTPYNRREAEMGA
jgi:hypothetical protein